MRPAIEVGPAERAAAASWCASQPFPSKQVEAKAIALGEYDEHSLVQAFALYGAITRAEVRAELVREIVQYLQQLDATRDESNLIGWAAKRVQAEFGGRDG